MSIGKRIKDVLKAVVAGTPTFQEKPGGVHDIAPIEQRKNTLEQGGTLGDPREQQRIAPNHRIICGMGSGGPEDVNTYAMYDSLPQAEKDAIRARSTLGPRAQRHIITEKVDADAQEERPYVPVEARGIADALDAHYIRDPLTFRMKLRPSKTCDHAEAKLRQDGYSLCPTCDGLIQPQDACHHVRTFGRPDGSAGCYDCCDVLPECLEKK